MAEDSKLEFRDLSAPDEGPYLTRPNHDAALETQLNAEAKAPVLQVNPNPLGSDEYVGTDPVYQNASTDANKPFAAEDGVEKDAEEHYKELYSLDSVDEAEVAEDYGFGGKARLAKQGGPERTRYLVPGQEGYDKAKAEEQVAPAVRADRTESNKDEGEQSEPKLVADNRGQNFGSTVQAPLAPESPETASEGSGDKPADEAPSKGEDDGAQSTKNRRSRS